MVDCRDCQHHFEEGDNEFCNLKLHMTLPLNFFDTEKECEDYIEFTDETPDETED
jgi:hypothetical protein